MKNYEVLDNLNKINKFIQREVENNKSFVSAKARFVIKKNLKALSNIYEIYMECLKEILGKYNVKTNEDGSIVIGKDNPEADKIQADLQSLLNASSEVVINKIAETDFTDDCLLGDMLLLDFMTESEE